MGIYLNPENVDFQEVLNSKIYVDKSELIQYTNSVLRTTQKYICVSRPRRFGKSMAANMLTAYYSRGCNSRELFQGLKIATHPASHPLQIESVASYFPILSSNLSCSSE